MAIYVLMLVAVCVVPFALAQRNASKRSVAKPAATDISKTLQLQLPHYIATKASADERVLNAAIPSGVCQFHVLIVYADPKPAYSAANGNPSRTKCGRG